MKDAKNMIVVMTCNGQRGEAKHLVVEFGVFHQGLVRLSGQQILDLGYFTHTIWGSPNSLRRRNIVPRA